MKSIIRYLLLIISIVLFRSFSSFSQNQEIEDTTDQKILIAAREIMSSTATCALITLDKDGRPRVRAMDPFTPEKDFTVWFGTNPNSRKVAQIKNDPRVTLYYLTNDASGYVMIHGIAELVNDQKEKKVRWKAEWNAFYSDRNENYLLIKVTPEWMEVISYKNGISGDPITWQPPVIYFNKKK